MLERALPLLEPDGACERREIVVETAFGGPGARDAFELARADGRSAEQEQRLDVLKQQMADRLMARPAEEVYDVVLPT